MVIGRGFVIVLTFRFDLQDEDLPETKRAIAEREKERLRQMTKQKKERLELLKKQGDETAEKSQVGLVYPIPEVNNVYNGDETRAGRQGPQSAAVPAQAG